MLSTGHTVSAAMMKSLPFDPVKDFAPVAMVATSCFVIVTRKDLPADDVKGLVALAKKDAGQAQFRHRRPRLDPAHGRRAVPRR